MRKSKITALILLVIAMLCSGLALYSILGKNDLDRSIAEGRVALIDLPEHEVKVGNVILKSNDTETYTEQHNDSSVDTLPPTLEAKESDPSIGKDNKEYIAPKISIIVVNVGLSRDKTEAALALSPKITLGINPYSYNIENIAAKIREKGGHKMVMYLPLQPENYGLNDPGPQALLNNLSKEENEKKLMEIITIVPDIVGLYSYSEDDYTTEPENVRLLLKIMKEKNLSFIYGGRKNLDNLAKVNVEIGAKYIDNPIFLDDKVDPNMIRENFAKLESLARSHNKAVGYINAYPLSLEELERWLASVENSEIEVVSIDTLLN